MTRSERGGWWQGPAEDLAAFRIVVFLAVLFSREIYDAVALAPVADASRVAPWGLEWAARWFPLGETAVGAAVAVLVLSSVLSVVGLWTRLSTLVSSATLAWVLAVPHFAGNVSHTHHLLWFALLVTASPSGDAWSVDAWRRHRGAGRQPSSSLAHGVPVRVAWIAIGLIFLFPGLWKWTVGPAWALDGVLRAHAEWKWSEGFGRPAIADVGTLLEWGGLGVMVLEVLILPGLIFSRSRPWTVGAALLFHAATALVLGISFSSLWFCYAVFVPWRALAERLRHRLHPRTSTADVSAPSPAAGEPRLATVCVAVLLLAGIIVSGAAHATNGYPFACYPTFHQRPASSTPFLEVEASRGGRWTTVDWRGTATQADWGVQRAIARRPHPTALRRWFDRLQSAHPELIEADAVRIHRRIARTDRPGEVDSARELLLEWRTR